MTKLDIEGWGETLYRVEFHKILNGFGNPETVSPLYIAANQYRVDPTGALHLEINDDEPFTTLAPGTWVRVTNLGALDDTEDSEDLEA